jgi:hypothetical protein
LKMYNDPLLNPSIYRSPAQAKSSGR